LLTTENKSAIAQRKRDHGKLEKMKVTEEKLERAQSEIEFLNAQLKPVENLLEQKTALENDNQFKKGKIEELEALVEAQSHDTLIQENREILAELEEAKQYIKVQESKYTEQTEQLKGDIEKLEALVKNQKDQKTDILFTMEKTLRDFKQFLPETSSSCEQCVSGFNWKEYRQSALKVIQNLEGYLQTKAR
jgi:chromosome segregation ATPase